MMISELISKLDRTGIKLWVEKDKLRYKAPEGALNQEIRDEILKYRPEIIDYHKKKEDQLCIHRLLENQVENRPEAVAVSCEEEYLTFRQLNSKANRLSRYLETCGVGTNDRIGFCVQHSIDMVVGILAILKAGGACVPLEPGYPRSFQQRILEENNVSILLTQTLFLETLPKITGKTICIDGLPGDSESFDQANPAFAAHPDNIAFILYSGDSWIPISHRAAASTGILWPRDQLNPGPGESYLFKTALSSENLPGDIFLPLCSGGQLVVVSPTYNSEVKHLPGIIEKQHINTAGFTANELVELLDYCISDPTADLSSLKLIFSSGEPLSDYIAQDFLDYFYTKDLKFRLYSFYNLTQLGGPAALYRHKTKVEAQHRKMIGDFNPNITFYILDKFLNPVPEGIPGEMYIALGEKEKDHLIDMDNWRRQIVKNPFLDDDDGYLLKINDKFRRLSDGRLEYLGSVEPLYRVKDYRIDINFLEAVILEQLEVDDCIVTVREINDHQKHILAYIVPSRANSMELIKERVRELLPPGMVPTAYIFVSHIPRDSSGDVDFESLSALEIIEPSLQQQWEEVLADLPGIRQAAVITTKRSRDIPGCHFSDIVDDWRQSTDARGLPEQQPGSQPDVKEPVSDKPAISHGGSLEIGAGEADTLAKVLIKTASCFPDKEIIYIHDTKTRTAQTYAELLHQARQILAGLRKAGLKPDDKVVFQLKDNRHFVPAFWGCVLGGFVPIPISVPPDYKKENSTAIKLYNTWFNFGQPVVLTDRENIGDLNALFDSLAAEHFQVEAVETIADNEPDTEVYPNNPEDLALILLTSGSTGLPKGVMQTHHSLITRTLSTIKYNAFTAEDISVNWLPLDHVVGLVMFHLRDVFLGATQVHMPVNYVLQDPWRWIREIHDFKATITWAPNFAFGLVNDSMEEDRQKPNWDLSSLRFIANAGELIVAKTVRQFLKHLKPYGLPIDSMKPGWGMSETCSVVTYNNDFSLENTRDEDAFVDVGKAIPGFSMRIVNQQDQILPETEVGHLQVKGPVVTYGYYLNENATSESYTRDGWFKTGDLALIIDGGLIITGRSKNEIIINGINYYSHEIESVVEGVEGVEASYTAACAIRSPGCNTDQLAIFFHTPFNGQQLKTLIEEIREEVVKQIGIRPDYLLPVEKEVIPKTNIGKLQHARLKKAFDAGEFDHILKQVDLLTGHHVIPNWFFYKTWKHKNIRTGTWWGNKRNQHFLIFKDNLGLSDLLVETLTRQGVTCIIVEIGECFKQLDTHHYCIHPALGEDYLCLLKTLNENHLPIHQVLHLWDYSKYHGEILSEDDLDKAQDKGIFSLLFLLQALNKVQQNRRDVIKLSVISSNTHYIRSEDKVSYEKSPIIGFLKTCSQEIQWLKSYHIDFAEANPGRDAAWVWKEIQGVHNDQLVAYRGEKRLVPALAKIDPDLKNKNPIPFKKGGFYLISGGLGGIGKKICEYLLKHYQAKLLVVGKTRLPHEDRSDRVPDRFKDYQELKRLEGDVLYHAADVCDIKALQQGVRKARDLWNQELDGILHLAGIFRECPLLEETRDNLEAVLKPKMQGTWVLNRLLPDTQEAVFISFSSVNGFWGGATVGGYSAASGFLNTFAQYQHSGNGHKALSLSWTMWDEIGMSQGYQMKELTRAQGFQAVDEEQGIYSLLFALQHPDKNLAIGLDSTNENILRYIQDKPYPLQKLTAYYTISDNINRETLTSTLSKLETTNVFNQLSRCEFIEISRMPLTPEGSIDRSQLQLIKTAATLQFAEYTPPRTEVEKTIIQIMKPLLRIPKIGVYDNFFKIGGQSILAMKFLSEIQFTFKINEEIPLKLLFDNPRVAELSRGIERYIEKSDQLEFSEIQPVSRDERIPLSFSQQRLWFLARMEPNIPIYNVPVALLLKGDLKVTALKKSINTIIKRHEVLRTTFKEMNGQAYQDIAEELVLTIPVKDLTEGDENQWLTSRDRLVNEMAREPFNLSQGPMIRAQILERSKTEHALLLNLHHIAADGWSIVVLMEELLECYSSYASNTPLSLPGLPIQYADFTIWQRKLSRTETYKKQLAYWKEQLRGELLILNLPTDRPRPAEPTSNGVKKYFEYSASLNQGLKELCRQYEVTMFMVLLAAFHTLLYRYSCLEDIIVGTPVANRNRKEIVPLIGVFINTLPIRLDMSNNPSFTQLLAQTREKVLDAFANQDFPFEQLVDELSPERNLSQNPVFQVLFVMQNLQTPPLKVSGLELEPLESQTGAALFDLGLSLSQWESKLSGCIDYKTDLFFDSTIQRMINSLENLLEGIAAGPGQKIAFLPLLSDTHRQVILEEWNSTQTDYPEELFLHKIFENQVNKTPDGVAAVFKDQHISYQQLNHKANQLARHLYKRGVKQEVLVGICIKRSLEMIIGVLSILKAGGSFAALDPAYPGERLSFMLNDTGVPVLLTEKETARGFSFDSLPDPDKEYVKPEVTPDRPSITGLDQLPIPDRTLINYDRYHKYMGISRAIRSITLQATRGCPFKCAYCHKIWPKTHIVRSADHIFNEIKTCYEAGARKFTFVDDVFNLDIKNASRFLEMIIKSDLDVNLYFTNGLRGDILKKEFIDLMMEAGAVDLMLALETASPRIQKLIGKNLNLERFEENLDYILATYPNVILDVDAMHGFPTETEEEAMMTLNFIFRKKWLHFPLVNVLKIFPNTEMYRLALESGYSKEAIERSTNQAYHELPDTLPFPKSFSIHCQNRFLNEYLLSRERLKAILPIQMKILTEEELVQKYDTYLPAKIEKFSHILEAADLTWEDLGEASLEVREQEEELHFSTEITKYFPIKNESPGAMRILLLDLSLEFTHECKDRVAQLSEQPLGLMYLMTYLNREFGDQVFGKIAKSKIDFDSYQELTTLVTDFKPDIIGVRTLTYFKEFFHKAVARIKSLVKDVPIITGGPYATSDFERVLQDPNIDLVVLGEGEITFTQLIGKMLENNKKLPGEEQLKEIQGIAFIKSRNKKRLSKWQREVLFPGQMSEALAGYSPANLDHIMLPDNQVYVIYTSGSTGRPKGISMTHRVITNLLHWQEKNLLPLETPKTLQFSSLNFDVSIQEMASAWGTGASLVLIPEEVQQNPQDLLKVIMREKVQRVFMPAIILHYLSEIAEDQGMYPVSVREFITAGEQLHISDSISQLLKHLHDYAVHNHYGVSESHVVTGLSLRGDVETWPVFPPVGKPIYNSRIYILDPYLQPVPIGVPGEIHIGGVGLSRAFANRPQLTAEKYIPDPFSSEKGARMYKSGDLGRFQPDGNIEFLGRIDTQVKVRGFRIELGEIETVINEYSPVQEAKTVVRTDRFNKQYLAAYVVVDKDQLYNETDLRELLKNKLPDYMVPSAIVVLDELPLTPSRKVDLRSLPDPAQIYDAGEKYIAPRNYSEELVAGVLSEVLGISRIGIKDDFFELGGHSLLATQVTSRIRSIFKVEFSVRSLFENPTIEELAAEINVLIQKETDTAEVPLVKQPVPDINEIPLSFSQERLWFIHQLIPESGVYSMPGALGLKGSLNAAALEQTLNKIIERHESLRTTFVLSEGKPVQKIASSLKLTLPIIDLSDMTDKKDQEDRIRDFISKEIKHHFDLSTGPLFRTTLLKRNKDEYVLIVNMHHIISDGWSMGIFVRELSVLYSAFAAGTSPVLPDLPIQYKDFAIWQRNWLTGNMLEKQLTYWKKQLGNGESNLDFPTDRPRPSMQTYNGRYEMFEISLSRLHELRNFCQKRGVTLFMILLAVFQTLLYRYSGQEDIMVGSPIANRNRSEIENLIGFFVNTLVLRVNLSGNPPFTELLSQVRDVTLDAYAHQDLPFEKLVEELHPQRDLSGNPLFRIVFALQNAPRSSLKLPGVTLTPVKAEYEIAKFDISLLMEESDRGLKGMLEYNTDLFDQSTIQRIIIHFRGILDKIIINPGQEIANIPLLTEVERNQVLREWNNTKTNYPKHKTIHELFADQVERSPDHVAIIGKAQGAWSIENHLEGTKGLATLHTLHISCQELDEQSHQLAGLLRERGVGFNTIVGIMVERSVDMIIGLLGILKVGAAYLPIDPSYPEKRINYMLADSGTKILLAAPGTQAKVKAEVKENPAHTMQLPLEFIEIAAEPASTFEHPPSTLTSTSTCQVSPANLAYIIYTSGSTGRPKGVPVQHKGFINLVYYHRKVFEEGPGDRMSQVAGPGFDAMGFEVWPCLLNGGTLIIADDETRTDVVQLKEWLIKNQVTVSFQPTVIAEQLLKEKWPQEIALRALRTAGEQLTCYPASSLPFRFYNLYGPTEDTVWTTWTEPGIKENNDPRVIKYPPIGKPIANHRVYIIGDGGTLQPIGVAGELCIAGEGLALGYLNQPQLTAQRFIEQVTDAHQPGRSRGRFFQEAPLTRQKQKIYRTGDLARWLKDGNIEFLGRIDFQVKIRGFRIELEEIEAQLLKHEKIKEALVLATENTQGEKYVCAYIVPEKSEDLLSEIPESPELKEYLSYRLPAYMVPTYFVPLDRIPLTTTGKIDRKALPVPEIAAGEDYVAPKNDIEKKLAAIWANVLNINQEIIGVHANFFDLGGHSLKATLMTAKASSEMQVDVPLLEVFKKPTIKKLAQYIQETRNQKGQGAAVIENNMVLLRKSTARAPHLFLLHDGSGEVDGYIDFCRHLEKEYNCWGIRADNLSKHGPQNPTIESMAVKYIEKIKKIQTRGPYWISGWSLGGTIALEMAIQLEQTGEEIAFLALFDSPGPGLETKTVHTRPDLLANKIKETLQHPGMKKTWQDIKRLNNARVRYVPRGKVQTALHFFKASRSPAALKESWTGYCQQPIRVYELPGDHFSIFKQPDVIQTASTFEAVLPFPVKMTQASR
jgi:amino acid adenylation domain-containing protein